MDSSIGASVADPVEERLRAALAPHLLLVRSIGVGGMARVYLAREPALKRLVAVKVLSSDYSTTTEGRARFEREAQAVAGLSHPNIVSIHVVGELDDKTPYFIMQYVEGPSMAQRVESEGPLSVAEARRVLGEVAAALAAAHQQKIIHRDIKPANILYEEATGRALVSDFGIAAVGTGAVGSKEAMRLTGTGVLVGTPAYMSPEQLLAEPVSEKTDIYSLGLLAHELLNGTGPFQASSPHELIAAYLRDTPKRLSQLRPDVDTELDELVARCLERDASKRPTADEVARRLSTSGAVLLEWPPPGLEDLHGQLRQLSKSYWWGGGLMIGTIAAAILAGSGLESVSSSLGGLVMLVGSITGILMLFVAVTRTVRLSRHIASAFRAGYSGMTVLETLADSRRDTGNVISASREYATLDATGRDRVRRHRVIRESLFALSGLLAVPLLVAALALGSSHAFGITAALTTLSLPVIAALAGLNLGERERRAFAKARRRKAGPSHADTHKLAGPWYESFESVRAGQPLGRGVLVSPRVGRGTSIAAALVVLALTLALAPLIVVTAGGPMLMGIAMPKFANTRSKAFIQRAARRYMLPPDSSITPLGAGRAYYSLLMAGGDRPRGKYKELPPPSPALPPFPWADALSPGLFPTAPPDQNAGLPGPLKIMAAARAGFSPVQMAFLERLAHAPHWRVVDSIARAPRMDYVGARFVLPFHEDAHLWEFPIPRFAGLKAIAYAGTSRAAYYYARGQRDSAETSLRQVISMGFVMADNGTTLIEQLIGIVITGIGREGLIDLYRNLGDPRGPQLRAQTDSLIAIVEGRTDLAVSDEFNAIDPRNAKAARRQLIRIIRNTKEMRGLRFELLHVLSSSPCTNLREMVFGPDPEVRAVFDDAHKTWARFPSDSAILDAALNSTERLEPIVASTSRGRTILRLTRFSGALLGNSRLAGCASLVAGGGG